jgi:hypothetical protein
MLDLIQKAFWSNKYKLWLTPLRPGKQVPEGASVLRGKGGASYYYNAKDQPPAPEEKKKVKPGQEEPALEQPDQNAAPKLYLEGLLGEKRMEDIPPEERLALPWRYGKIAINQIVHIPEATRNINGKLKTIAAHDEKQATWMLPGEYYAGLAAGKHYELDQAKNDQHNIRLPTPDDPDRRHIHEGAMEPHQIKEVHQDENADIGHRDEVDRYDRAFNRQTQADWMEQYQVQVKPNVGITLGGHRYSAMKYDANGLGGPIYVFDSGIDKTAVFSAQAEKKLQLFDRPTKAHDYIRDLVIKFGKPQQQIKEDWNASEIDDEESEMEDPNIKPLYQNKSMILQKFQTLILKAEEAESKTFGEYKSGDDKITFVTLNDQYVVKVNDHPVLTTENFGEAIAKFYQEVSRLIQAQTVDKDMALNIFGEKVVQTNRKVIPMLNGLGKSVEAWWLKNLDLNCITLPFNPDVIKYEPIAHVFPTVAMYEEMGQGAAEGGKKPMRDANEAEKVSPTYQMTHRRHEQDPIVEKSISDSEIISIGESLGISADLMDGFIQGFKVETEHAKTVNGDKETIGRIAKDHLREDPEYYTKLDEMENGIDIKKAFWSKKFHLWLNPIKRGERLPKGAVLFRGQAGGMYYYFPGGRGGPGQERIREPQDVQQGHGVQAQPWGAEATRHREAMAEREGIRRPYGENPPGGAARKEPNQVVDPNKTPALKPVQNFRDAFAERLKRLQEEREAAEAKRKQDAEDSKVKAAADANQYNEEIDIDTAKEFESIISLHSANDVAITGFDKVNPDIYTAVQENLNKPIEELNVIEENANKKVQYLGSLIDAAANGDLNDLLPDLPNKVPEIKNRAAKAKYAKDLLGPLKAAKNFNKYDPEFPQFLVQRTIAKTFSDSNAKVFITEKQEAAEGGLGGGVVGGKKRLKFKNNLSACFKPKDGEVNAPRHAIPQGTGYIREMVCEDVDKILGWGIVPTTVVGLKNIDGDEKLGSIQQWVTDGKVGARVEELMVQSKYADSINKLMVFDMVTGNQDRHHDNFIYHDDGRLTAIDNGLSFYTKEGKRNGGVRNWFLHETLGGVRYYDKKPDKVVKIPDTLINDVAKNKEKIVSYVTHSLGKDAGLLTLKRINHIINKKTFSDFGWDKNYEGWQ